MKRISAAALALLMVVSIQNSVPAEENKPLRAPLAGFTFEMPEKYQKLQGQLDFGGGGPESLNDPGLVCTSLDYYGVRESELDAYSEYMEAYGNAITNGEEIPQPPKEEWGRRHLQMVLFGRYYCKAIKPMCDTCLLKDICSQ